jgi:hypothetical protein
MNVNYLILILFLFLSCRTDYDFRRNNIKSVGLNDMRWLIGNWEMNIEGSKLYENWEKNGKKYSGKSFMTLETDTLFSESISLELRENILCYVVSVKNQNNNQAVVFKYKEFIDNEFRFENLEHDYPHRIVYKKINSNKLYARIEGNDKGKLQQDSFLFTKLKQK